MVGKDLVNSVSTCRWILFYAAFEHALFGPSLQSQHVELPPRTYSDGREKEDASRQELQKKDCERTVTTVVPHVARVAIA